MHVSKCHDETYHFVCQLTLNWLKYIESVYIVLGRKWETYTRLGEDLGQGGRKIVRAKVRGNWDETVSSAHAGQLHP